MPRLSKCLFERVPVAIDLPQVDSLIFLVMARYIGTIKKLKRAKTSEIGFSNRFGASESLPLQ